MLVAPPACFDPQAPVRITEEDLSRLSERTDLATGREVLKEARARELARTDPVILGSFIVRTAYRLIREWGRTINAFAIDEFLSDLTLDRFLVPVVPSTCPMTSFSLRAYSEFKAITTSPVSARGIPILPSDHETNFNKHVAHAYTRIMGNLSTFLRLDETDYGPPALPYLLQTPPNPKNWPDLYRLQEYEIHLVGEVLDILLDKGTRNAKDHLREVLSLRDHEINNVIRLAKIESRRRMEHDIEEERAILSMRLEDLIHRAREALDMRVELGAIKQLAIVQGVTRAEPDDAMSEFANVIRKVANSAAPALPPAPADADP